MMMMMMMGDGAVELVMVVTSPFGLPARDQSEGCCVASGTFPLEQGITSSGASCLFLTLFLKGSRLADGICTFHSI